MPATNTNASSCQKAMSVSATSAVRPKYITDNASSEANQIRCLLNRSASAPTNIPNNSRGSIRTRNASATLLGSPVSS